MKSRYVSIDFIEVDKINHLIIEGRISRGVKLRFCDEEIEFSYSRKTDRSTARVSLKKHLSGDVQFIDNQNMPVRVEFGEFAGLANMIFAYKHIGGILLRRQLSGLSIRRYSQFRHVVYELFFLLRIIVNWNITGARRKLFENGTPTISSSIKSLLFIAEAIATIPESLMLRIAYYFNKPRNNYLWFISDRGAAAGDNGEALFHYVNNQDDSTIRSVFALSKKSPDYARLKDVGEIVSTGSFRYKLTFLRTSHVISSHADIETTNPFYRQKERYKDLMQAPFVFLQHGVIRHNHADWLNRYNKNIQLFITSAHKEYDSILHGNYFYKSKNIALTGLPRFDYLESTSHNKIIIAPTYRAGLLRGKTNKFGERAYDPTFKNTDYFNFYNNLINDENLQKAAKKYGYKIELLIHPNFEKQRRDFTVTGQTVLPDYPYNYRQIISEGSLLVSDYSSIVFDFAYLKKPVIYTKFDENEFYQTHTYSKSDFFDDETDGFGVVTHNYDGLVEEIVTVLQNGCKMSEKYVKRVDTFFYKVDQNNTKRVYDAIIESTI